MKDVLITFEVLVSKKGELNIVAKPDYTIQNQFDLDDKKSCFALWSLESKVKRLKKSLESLGFNVSIIKKEVSHLD